MIGIGIIGLLGIGSSISGEAEDISEYIQFFLNNTGSVVQLECLEISHPSFTQTYYVVRNATNGITVTHEDEVEYDYDYYPLKLQSMGARGDLDQGYSVTFGDLGEVLPAEIDAVTSDDGFSTKPTVKYRTYRSDDLTRPMFGPLILEVTTFSFNREASTFEARAPRLNINRTGELYNLDRFSLLRGYL